MSLDKNDFYMSDDNEDNDGEDTEMHRSIYDMEISNINPELMRIFNLTPPLNDNNYVQPNTIIPYYIVIYNHIPIKYSLFRIVNGKTEYHKMTNTFEEEIVQIMNNHRMQSGSIYWDKHIHHYDDFIKYYFVERFLPYSPFDINYFLNGEWRIFNLTNSSKKIVYKKCISTSALQGSQT
jgi:hypothetical protein